MKNVADVNRTIGNIGLIPVVAFDNATDAVDTAAALTAGGIDVMEITLRTSAGIESISKVAKAFPDMLVGAGTVRSVEQAAQAKDAGAVFIVSPGFDEKVVEWCIKNDILITPGCVTPTEIEKAQSYGLSILKYFPANVYGGIEGIKALHGPYKDIKFIPTGGVSLTNLADFVDKDYVHAIGGGFLCKSADIASKSFNKITATAKQAIEVLLGFELAHIGMNGPASLAEKVNSAFGFEVKEGNSSFMVGNVLEVVKENGIGKNGHIAFRTSNIDRAIYYLSKRGFEVDKETEKLKNGKTVAIYLKDDFNDFAVHLLQK
ncbi:MAG: bifunctional 4-hydroxy-2-oxoglutarate aldolase/2-dehydro-3-deoxy-phosphogluconate aldolase [Clostridiales bacterium]|nr:bifunctional 4-hydroxy-2-oxoglutarate aldolase/2-dehydro-3-deoxy-phosphogluconate aldolase [Clostridiales bacterium]